MFEPVAVEPDKEWVWEALDPVYCVYPELLPLLPYGPVPPSKWRFVPV